MRRIVFRALLIAVMPIAIFAAPEADAAKQLPGGCDLFANTHCHCIGPNALSCFVEPID